MKTRAIAVVTLVSLGLTLSGCDKVKGLVGGNKPSGQVVATVDGEEVTSLELRSELGGFGSRDPQVMKAAQQQALQRIILRKLLAKQARDQKLDKTPDFAIQMERGKETLLAQLYERKLATAINPPTRQDAEAFVASNPGRFANRRILFVDQVISPAKGLDPARIQPLKTLGEVKAMLNADGVTYQENSTVLDTLSADARLVSAIDKLPPGEVFVIPQGGAVVFNQVATTRSVPLSGDAANAFAMNVLRNQRAQETVAKKVTDLRKAAESKITYNPAFKPPPPKKAGAPTAAPASPPAAPAAPEAK